jgi:hypothetical protein
VKSGARQWLPEKLPIVMNQALRNISHTLAPHDGSFSWALIAMESG